MLHLFFVDDRYMYDPSKHSNIRDHLEGMYGKHIHYLTRL